MANGTPTTPSEGVNALARPIAVRREAGALVGSATDRRTPRRRFLAEAGATIAASLGVTAAVLAPDPVWGTPVSTSPDAALIAAYDNYVRALATYNQHGGQTFDPNDDPLWHALEAAEERAADIPAETMAGLAAKARAAAAAGRMPDGSVNLGDSYAGNWPRRLVCDVLRLSGAEVPA